MAGTLLDAGSKECGWENGEDLSCLIDLLDVLVGLERGHNLDDEKLGMGTHTQ